MKEKDSYFLYTGKIAKPRLDALNELVNDSSQKFLFAAGLKPGMTVLEIGCGVGQMSVWLAQNVIPGGKVVCVDSSEKQIELAKSLAKRSNVTNIEFYTHSAEEISSLDVNDKFDIIFARFVFIHLTNPKSVFKQLKSMLTPKKGVLVVQEFVIDHLFRYPESEILHYFLSMVLDVYRYSGKDPNLGKKIVDYYKMAGLKILDYEFHHPLLKTKEDKKQIVSIALEFKDSFINQGLLNEVAYGNLIRDLEQLIEDEDTVLSHMPNMIVSGVVDE